MCRNFIFYRLKWLKIILGEGLIFAQFYQSIGWLILGKGLIFVQFYQSRGAYTRDFTVNQHYFENSNMKKLPPLFGKNSMKIRPPH